MSVNYYIAFIQRRSLTQARRWAGSSILRGRGRGGVAMRRVVGTVRGRGSPCPVTHAHDPTLALSITDKPYIWNIKVLVRRCVTLLSSRSMQALISGADAMFRELCCFKGNVTLQCSTSGKVVLRVYGYLKGDLKPHNDFAEKK